jgi:hypothetical protein
MAFGYIYRFLIDGFRTIRLVIILSDVNGDEIRCKLRLGYLDESPVYKILLYVWGDPKYRKQIFFDEYLFSVITNLYAGLYCLWDSI